MKRVMTFAVMAVLLFTLAGCRKKKEDLKFYVVSGAYIAEGMSADAALSAAKKKGRLAFTGEDIAGWYWEEHQVLLQNVQVLGAEGDGGSKLFQASAEDYFVLAIGGRAIYAGGFAPAGGSVKALRNPYIQDGEGDTFFLRCDQRYAEGEDPRANTYLYDYLTDQQLLVSAIKVASEKD